jgi:hypothetical protein
MIAIRGCGNQAGLRPRDFRYIATLKEASRLLGSLHIKKVKREYLNAPASLTRKFIENTHFRLLNWLQILIRATG